MKTFSKRPDLANEAWEMNERKMNGGALPGYEVELRSPLIVRTLYRAVSNKVILWEHPSLLSISQLRVDGIFPACPLTVAYDAGCMMPAQLGGRHWSEYSGCVGDLFLALLLRYRALEGRPRPWSQFPFRSGLAWNFAASGAATTVIGVCLTCLTTALHYP